MSAITARLKLITVDWLNTLMILLTLAGLGVSFYLMWGYTALSEFILIYMDWRL